MSGCSKVLRDGELGPLEAEILEALFRLHLPIAMRSPDGSEDHISWPTIDIARTMGRLNKGGEYGVGASLNNLQRKGFIGRTKTARPGMRRQLHWQITVAGCGALMRRRTKDESG